MGATPADPWHFAIKLNTPQNEDAEEYFFTVPVTYKTLFSLLHPSLWVTISRDTGTLPPNFNSLRTDLLETRLWHGGKVVQKLEHYDWYEEFYEMFTDTPIQLIGLKTLEYRFGTECKHCRYDPTITTYVDGRFMIRGFSPGNVRTVTGLLSPEAFGFVSLGHFNDLEVSSTAVSAGSLAQLSISEGTLSSREEEVVTLFARTVLAVEPNHPMREQRGCRGCGPVRRVPPGSASGRRPV